MASKIKYSLDFDYLTAEEEILLDKACEAIAGFVSKSDQINKVNHKTRDAHVTPYSTLKGIFFVNDNFEESHVFPDKELNCLIRISNAHLKKVSQESTVPAYGFSLKILDGENTVANFPLVNFPLFPINNVSRFLKLFISINRFFSGNFLHKIWNLFGVFKNLISVSPSFFQPSFIMEVLKFLKNWNHFILSFSYHSIGVYRLGDHLVKLKLIPRKIPKRINDKRIDDSIKNYLNNNSYELDLFVQYCCDLKKQPVNQLNKLWKDSESIQIGTIKISGLIDRNDRAVEEMSFNPFENIKALQPVGRIQKLRDKAYKTSYKIRNNNQL